MRLATFGVNEIIGNSRGVFPGVHITLVSNVGHSKFTRSKFLHEISSRRERER